MHEKEMEHARTALSKAKSSGLKTVGSLSLSLWWDHRRLQQFSPRCEHTRGKKETKRQPQLIPYLCFLHLMPRATLLVQKRSGSCIVHFA